MRIKSKLKRETRVRTKVYSRAKLRNKVLTDYPLKIVTISGNRYDDVIRAAEFNRAVDGVRAAYGDCQYDTGESVGEIVSVYLQKPGYRAKDNERWLSVDLTKMSYICKPANLEEVLGKVA